MGQFWVSLLQEKTVPRFPDRFDKFLASRSVLGLVWVINTPVGRF